MIISGKPAEADKKVPPSSLYLVGIFDLLWILKPCYRRNFHSRASIEILFSFEKTPDTSSCPNNCKLKYFTNKLNVGTNIVHLSQIFSELMQKRINIFFKYTSDIFQKAVALDCRYMHLEENGNLNIKTVLKIH